MSFDNVQIGYVLVPVKVKYIRKEDNTVDIHSVVLPLKETCEKAVNQHMSEVYQEQEEAFGDLANSI